MICECCNGNGWLYSDSGPAPKIINCPECEGAGEWEDEEEEDAD